MVAAPQSAQITLIVRKSNNNQQIFTLRLLQKQLQLVYCKDFDISLGNKLNTAVNLTLTFLDVLDHLSVTKSTFLLMTYLQVELVNSWCLFLTYNTFPPA